MGKDKWWALIKVFLREETKSESSWYSLTFISDLVNLTIGLVVTFGLFSYAWVINKKG